MRGHFFFFFSPRSQPSTNPHELSRVLLPPPRRCPGQYPTCNATGNPDTRVPCCCNGWWPIPISPSNTQRFNVLRLAARAGTKSRKQRNCSRSSKESSGGERGRNRRAGSPSCVPMALPPLLVGFHFHARLDRRFSRLDRCQGAARARRQSHARRLVMIVAHYRALSLQHFCPV